MRLSYHAHASILDISDGENSMARSILGKYTLVLLLAGMTSIRLVLLLSNGELCMSAAWAMRWNHL